MSFWNKKQINSDEYEKLTKKIIELNSDVSDLTAKIRILTSDNSNLRGLFNRKLTGLKKEEIPEETTEEKDINNSILVPYSGNFR